jgi:dihydroxy-acid dehydratase
MPEVALRSKNWFGRKDLDGFAHRSWIKAEGFSDLMFDGRPVIGIANSWSELTNCNAHLRTVAEAVKRGVLSAGGFPLEFPTISLGEVLMKPTTMMFRNLMAMDVEECIRAYPLDGVILLSGCDKTTPAMLMGAASADVPAILLTGGPMLNGIRGQEQLGSGTDTWRLWAEHRAGRLTEEEFCELESCMSRSAGHCMVMGTASTMAAITEALGMALPGSAAIPAVHADRLRAAEASGRRAVELVANPIRPSQVITAQSVENAMRVLLAIGGSTNAIVHLTAIAGRVGVKIDLNRLNQLSDSTPVLVDLKPTGQFYMSDLYAAGGVGAVLRELKPLLHLDCMTVTGETIGERLAHEAGAWVDRAVVRPLADPLAKEGGLVALFGSLAPNGAILKRSAADANLFEREGRAVVFTSLDDMAARVDDPALDVTPEDFMVLQNAGPKSGYAMPEAGYLPIPQKLARAGLKDMVRISDARMSGTAYGTIVLHVSPEAAAGGPLALVRNGDRIRLSVKARRIELLVPEAELAKRKAAWKPPVAVPARGYAKLYMDHVLQAEHGCDFDFLRKA